MNSPLLFFQIIHEQGYFVQPAFVQLMFDAAWQNGFHRSLCSVPCRARGERIPGMPADGDDAAAFVSFSDKFFAVCKGNTIDIAGGVQFKMRNIPSINTGVIIHYFFHIAAAWNGSPANAISECILVAKDGVTFAE